MSKLFRALALSAMLAGAATVSVSNAQEKGKPAKTDDDKKPGKKTKKGGGIVQIKESAANGKYYMSIRDGEGKFLAQGGPGGYETKDDALKALEAIKAAVEDPKIEYPAKKSDDKEEMKEKTKDKKKKGA